MAEPPTDDAEAVLVELELSGAFDELRKQLLGRLIDNEELQGHSIQKILESKHLPQPAADKRALNTAYELIRKELTPTVMEKLPHAVWDEMNKDHSILQDDINNKTHEALCKVYEKRRDLVVDDR